MVHLGACLHKTTIEKATLEHITSEKDTLKTLTKTPNRNSGYSVVRTESGLRERKIDVMFCVLRLQAGFKNCLSLLIKIFYGHRDK